MTESLGNFPSVEETTNHPGYKSAVWKLEPHSAGHLPVANGRGGPFNMYWEIHGSGPTKLVFIMGLASTLTSWQIQTYYFGHLHGAKYSVLVLDNRGIGRSDKPLAWYRTSQMARDVVEVIDHVGWTNDRQLNIMGISLGGMVAQEMACLIPNRIQSLSLICTSARIESGKTLMETIQDRINLLRPKSEDQAIKEMAFQLFTPDFLLAKDELGLPSPQTTEKCTPVDTADGEYQRFDSNFQRYQAQELHKRREPGLLTKVGFFCQAVAAMGHKKSATELRKMADDIGRERILVLHGTKDNMLIVRNGETLIRLVEPGVGMVVDGMGHAPTFERSTWFNKLMDERFEACSKL